VFLRRPLFHRLLRIAMAIAAALATMIARTGDLPPAAGVRCRVSNEAPHLLKLVARVECQRNPGAALPSTFAGS
jgi:hypothetical protein